MPLQLLTQPKNHHHPNGNKVVPITTEDEEHPLAATEQDEQANNHDHGQNFAHLQCNPVVIHVQLDHEDENAVEVRLCQSQIILKLLTSGIYRWTLWKPISSHLSS